MLVRKHSSAVLLILLLAFTTCFSSQPGRFQLTSIAAAAEQDTHAKKWTCPMHPHYIATDAGACPICGMDLVALNEVSKDAKHNHEQHRTEIAVAPEVIQSMGVRLANVETASFGRVIRSYGLVAENDRLQTELTARLEGWIEDLKIQAVGDEVKKGDLLFTLYAPEFLVTQRDYLDSLRARNPNRIRSIKTRLRAFGMQERAIQQLVKTRRVMDFVPFYALQDGTVAHIELRPGTYVNRGTMLTRIQDYRQIWLLVQVPEKDLSFIKVGTPAKVTFPNIPGREVFSKVEYIYPTVNSETRTGQVRLVLDNADGQLRPGAYADVAFEVSSQKRVAVPSEAILPSGAARYVIASLGEGRFEPRSVKVGLTSGPWTEIEGELKPGDKIVVSGQFLIDSESALRESFRKLEKLKLPLSLLKLSKTQLAMLDHMVDAALYMHEALIDGYDLEANFLQPAIEVKTLLWPKFQHTQLAFVMDGAVAAIEKAKQAQTESGVRTALAELVAALEPWIREGAPDHYREKKVVLYRDTARGNKWLQLSTTPQNPYGAGEADPLPLAKRKAKSTNAATAKHAITPAPKEKAPRGSALHNH